jgi:hypothetical protein
MSRFLTNLAMRGTGPPALRPRLFGSYESAARSGPSFVEWGETAESAGRPDRPVTGPHRQPSQPTPAQPAAFGQLLAAPPAVTDGEVRVSWPTEARPRVHDDEAVGGPDVMAGTAADGSPEAAPLAAAPRPPAEPRPPAAPAPARLLAPPIARRPAVEGAAPAPRRRTGISSPTSRTAPAGPRTTAAPGPAAAASAPEETTRAPEPTRAAREAPGPRAVGTGQPPRPAERADQGPIGDTPAPIAVPRSGEVVSTPSMVVQPGRSQMPQVDPADWPATAGRLDQRPRREAARRGAEPAGLGGAAGAAPTIHVTIGRIEVRAAAAPAARPERHSSRHEPMGLEEYLRQRSQRGGAA